MILYLDTSDLFKMYVREDDWPRPWDSLAMADLLASSRPAYVETRAALARALSGGRLARQGVQIGPEVYGQLIREFRTDWRHCIKIDVSPRLLIQAGELAEKHGLRAGDAIHLASGIRIRSTSVEEVLFSVADADLREAALAEGFVVV
jgi:predicted nucleic acid-binding protein